MAKIDEIINDPKFRALDITAQKEVLGVFGATPSPVELPDTTEMGRVGAQMVGGAIGGTVGAASPVPGAAYIGTGLGSAAGGQIYDIAKSYITTGGPPQDPMQQAIRAGYDVALETVTPKAFDVGVDVVKGVASKTMQPIKSRMAGAGSKELLSDFTDLGVTPKAGAISGNQTVQGMEEALGATIGGGRTMQQASQRTLDDLTNVHKELSEKFGNILTKEELGEIAKKSSGKVIENFKSVSENLYEPINKAVAPDELVRPVNTLDALESMIGSLKNAPKTSRKLNAELVAIRADLVNDLKSNMYEGIPYEALRRWRSTIGEAIGKGDLLANVNMANKKRLYAALSKDSEEIAKQFGVHGDLELANKYYAMMQTSELPIFQKIIGKTEPEDVFNVVMQASEKGGSRLRKLRRNMPNKDWDAFSGSTLYNMGLARPGSQGVEGNTFSPATFLTNWNKMSKEAKDVMFRGGKYEKLRPQLDKFLRVSASLKDSEKILNRSNTGRLNAMIQFMTLPTATSIVGGPMAGLGTVAGQIAIPYKASQLITSPWFVKWITEGAKLAKSNPNNLGSHMARLVALGKENNQSEGVNELVKATENLLGIESKSKEIKPIDVKMKEKEEKPVMPDPLGIRK